ncbi:hypothetical protein Tco_0289520 [Tanacetum coccineum]
MTNLKFTDTHNMVAFLSKPDESDEFEQIVDFLNAHSIRYALTVNPTIYISCIEQFWSTGVVKTINGEVQLHALVDGKEIIISEAYVRRDLKLEDEEGMIRNLDNVSGKFLRYPRNMRRVEKGFSGRVTRLFPTMVVQHQSQMGEGSANPTDPHHTPIIIQPSTQPQKTQKPRKPKRKDTQVSQPSDPSDNVEDEAIHKELGDSLVRAATTASSLEAEQDSGNITKTRSKATPNESSSLGTTSGGGPRGNTLRSDEDRLKLNELMELCTTLQNKVLDLEKTKTTKANKIAKSSGDEESLGEDASKQGRINAIDADEDITLVNVQDDADKEMYDVGTVTGDEVFAEQEVAAKDVNLTVDEVTLAQALAALKSVKPKVKGDVIEEPNVPVNAASASTKVSAATTTTATIPTPRKGIVITELGTPTITRSSQQPSQAEVQDKGKGKMIEPEPVKKMSKKDQLRSDEEEAKRLQAEFDEEERLAREKDEANVALTEEWDDIQAKIEADHELAQRLQAEEQEELSVEEKAKLFQQLLEQRRKHFAAKSAEEKRNKPPTQAQQRKIMCTYLKNMEGKKLKDLKNKSFDSIQKMFDRAFKRVNTFVDFRTDLVEGSSKRAGEELEQESTKKQKVDEDKDTVELQSLMEVIPDKEEVAIDAVPLATKPPTIVDWKIHKEGKNIYFQIIRANGSSKMYLVFSQLLKSVDKEDLVELYKLVKAKYGSTRPVEDMDLLL